MYILNLMKGGQKTLWASEYVPILLVYWLEVVIISWQFFGYAYGIHMVNLQNVILISQDEWNYAFFPGKK